MLWQQRRTTLSSGVCSAGDCVCVGVGVGVGVGDGDVDGVGVW